MREQRSKAAGSAAGASADTAEAAARDDGAECEPADVAGGRQEEPQSRRQTCGERFPVSGSLQTGDKHGRLEDRDRNQL